ncbi:hypothetical protein GZH49_31635 [Nocardia terpenica]|uniref:Uncharacterized protein n=2 Tax=Nocardia terpenica TaxID=455432 RepID=A0A291RLN1_9NOCA|nr:hypothetical protein CRH09_19730 [Nocardia terpenica]
MILSPSSHIMDGALPIIALLTGFLLSNTRGPGHYDLTFLLLATATVIWLAIRFIRAYATTPQHKKPLGPIVPAGGGENALSLIAITRRAIMVAFVVVGVAGLVLHATDHDFQPSAGGLALAIIAAGALAALLSRVSATMRASKTASAAIVVVVCVLAGIAQLSLVHHPTAARPGATFDTKELEKVSFQKTSATGKNGITVGGCISLTTTGETPRIDRVTCSDSRSNYRIAALSDYPAGCPTDVDQKFFTTTESGEPETLCLDYAWMPDQCLQIRDNKATPTPCGTTGSERPAQLITDTTSTDKCRTGGYTHPTRRFTVCTETSR